jgi:hypothetical protein
MKIAATGVDSRVAVWEREFLLVRSQRFRVGGQLAQEVRITSVVPQGSLLDPLLLFACINDVWRNTEPTIRLSAEDCIIYRKIKNDSDIDTLQINLGRLAVEIAMKINPGKNTSVSFTRARVKDPLNYFWGPKNSGSE